MSDYEDAAKIIEDALRAEVVLTGGFIRLRPATDEVIALNIMEALSVAGFEIVRKTDSE
ncbi:hypothetical protein [Sphingopyxis sp.]|uniref:hypothetical protein n=1 Tax=Sphingopyxis sp. TaxID=1908224 RepID=UPI003D1062F2